MRVRTRTNCGSDLFHEKLPATGSQVVLNLREITLTRMNIGKRLEELFIKPYKSLLFGTLGGVSDVASLRQTM